MFGGNAKTHFQVIGRNTESTGYMMSPFGDERWDVDDNEKLSKVLKKKSLTHSPYYDGMAYQQQQLPYRISQQIIQEPVRHPQHGYIHQSGTAQGYMPKTEVAHNYTSGMQTSQNYYRNQEQYTVPVTHTSQNPNYYGYAPVVSTSRTISVNHNNGLNHEDIKKRTRGSFSQPAYYERQTLSQSPTLCDRCQYGHSSKKSQEYIMPKTWKASQDVPVLIAGEAGYKPFGPEEATPNPFYPMRERSMYTPLR